MSRSQFGELLRAARGERSLTQDEFARRAGIGVRTLRDLERGRARPHRATVELLLGVLGATGAEREALLAASGRIDAMAGPTINLPPRPSLIGRDGDVAALRRAVLRNRLTTLVGVAGIGKTSLAIEVAHAVGAELSGGSAAIAVTEVSTPADITTASAAVFDIARAAELPARMAGRDALLVIDGAERAPEEVAEVLTGLTAAVPSLRILVTSRHPIGVPGERIWPISPLDVPAPGVTDGTAYPAVALFIARLETVRLAPVADAEAELVVRLVQRIGGLPLALELAAARGRILEIAEILERYGDRVLDLGVPAPSGPTRRTLRDAVGQSYRLLDSAGQEALRRLTGFRHRWSLEMAEPLLTGPSSADPVDLLERLADLGLVQIRSGTALRFRLLDVVREFGAEQRDLAGETGAVAQAHARVIVAQVSRIAPALAGAEFLAAVRQLDAIASDIRAALDYAGEHDPDLALALAASLPRWWRFRGRDREGRDLLRRLLDVADAEPRVRAWAELGTALLALEHGDGVAELPRARSALSTFVTLEDVGGQLAAHTQLVALYHSDGAYDLARSHGEASLALATRSGRRRDQLVASTNLTWHDIRTGDLRAARQRLAALRTLAGELGEQRLESLALANLAEVERLDRRLDDAVRTGRQAVRALEQQGDPRHRRNTLGTVAIALAESGRAPEARELLASLRSAASGGTGDGTFAMIEAYLALGSGDRWSAAQWFGEARSALVGQQDVRDTVEALVGLAATAPDPDVAARARAELAEICRSSAVTLLPRDRLMLETERLGPTTSVNRPEP